MISDNSALCGIFGPNSKRLEIKENRIYKMGYQNSALNEILRRWSQRGQGGLGCKYYTWVMLEILPTL
jgi:hypothetical protein